MPFKPDRVPHFVIEDVRISKVYELRGIKMAAREGSRVGEEAMISFL